MIELVLATRNEHKTREIREILGGLPVRILNLEEAGSFPEVVEDGRSFEENAVKKAMTIARASGMISMADDSGLVVDALDGQPGVFSARFAGLHATDAENNAKLLALLDGIGLPERKARFICCVAICDPRGQCTTVQGSCEGHIALQASGSGGFGYDPLFVPNGHSQSFAELPAEVKNAISHRGRALLQVRQALEELITVDDRDAGADADNKQPLMKNYL